MSGKAKAGVLAGLCVTFGTLWLVVAVGCADVLREHWQSSGWTARQVWGDGRDAALSGRGPKSCPHPEGDTRRRAWMDGWQAGFVERTEPKE